MTDQLLGNTDSRFLVEDIGVSLEEFKVLLASLENLVCEGQTVKYIDV